jgi:hypothetical protein
VEVGRIARALVVLVAIGLCALIFATYFGTTEVEHTLPKSALHGRVTDDHGAPLEAKLFLRRRDQRFAATLNSRTYGRGQYVFPQVEAGPWNLHVVAEHFVTRTVPIDKLAGTSVELDFELSPGSSIRGRIEGTNPAGWSIHASANGLDDFEGELWRRMVTGNFVSAADGTFVIDGLADGEYRLALMSPDLSVTSSEMVVAKSGDTNVVLQAPTRGELRVRVRFEGADPPETFTAGVITRSFLETFHAQPGTFAIAVPVGENVPILVRADGFVSQYLNGRADESGTGELGITLHAAANLRGRVLARGGEPIAGAVVVALPNRVHGGQYDSPQTTTGEDGRFTLDGLSQGEVVVGIWASGWGYTHASGYAERTKRDPFARKTHRTPLEIRLSPGVSIEGLLTLAGKPLASALLHFEPEDLPKHLSQAYGARPTPPTDPAGRFRITDVAPGRYMLSIRASPERDDVGVGRSMAIIVPDSGLANLDIELADGGNSLVLLLPPLDGFWFATITARACESLRATCCEYYRMAKGGTRARFDGLLPGDYTVEIVDYEVSRSSYAKHREPEIALTRKVTIREGDGALELNLE